jgi:hypothetical protein
MRTASIVRAMTEAERISESSVHFNVTTRRYIPADSKFHTRRRENLISHVMAFVKDSEQWNKHKMWREASCSENLDERR